METKKRNKYLFKINRLINKRTQFAILNELKLIETHKKLFGFCFFLAFSLCIATQGHQR